MNVVPVILAGGGGTRFWPLSRQNKPKQLLNLSGHDIMLNDTILRYHGIIPLENTMIVTNRSQTALLYEIALEQVPRENILVEPTMRNTAACILYAAFVIQKKFLHPVMVVLPSDHYFTHVTKFQTTLMQAIDIAMKSGKLLTIGIKPTFPATGYGYIRYQPSQNQGIEHEYHDVTEFVEKPPFEKAKGYLESGEYLWNSGIFIWKAEVILENYRRFLPRLYKKMMEISDTFGTTSEQEALARVYSSLSSISIDYGILERSDEVLVVPGDFGWNDVGSWDALGALFPADENGNIIKARHIGLDTSNAIIYGDERLIATIGVEGLIIVETGDAVLICTKNHAQDVKELVELLKEKGMHEYI